jgi:hypothetical protein
MNRRDLLGLVGAVGVGSLWRARPGEPWPLDPVEPLLRQTVADNFPRHNLDAVQEVVGASHTDLARVKELVTRQPSLAKAAWDWGFGDWETALGAASHVGRREIAHLLLEYGAPPTIFSAAMLGQLDVVKAMIAASPGIQGKRGPHGIPLLSHAQAGGPEATAVVAYLKDLGGADVRPALTPISAEDRARVSGSYRFGQGTNDVFVVDDVRDQLGLTRAGRNRQWIYHLGNWTFYPTGAEAVRLTFTRVGDRAASFTIADPEVVITAIREA